MTLTVGSLFAGIGGFDIAAERAGMEVLWQSEYDPHASRVLDHHWPDIKNLGDIHDIRNPEPVDVLCGGFPCQDYSVAGARAGLAGDRGALWWQYHRLITELNPRWVVAENVPGLLSSRGGQDFATIIDSLVDCGYGVVWRVLDAQWFGVAQRRRRVFIVGHSGGQPRPEVLALGQSVSGDTPPSRIPQERVADLTANGLGGGGPDDNLAQAGHLLSYKGPTIDIEEPSLIAFPWQASWDASVEDGTTPTLPSGQTLAIAQNQRGEVRDLGDRSAALAAQPGMTQQTYVVANTLKAKSGGNHVEETYLPVNGSIVRRLTPLECERLQGFPDRWTDVPGNSDTQRYRQLGNAVAVPVVEWIMKRIMTTHLPDSR